MLQVVLVGQFCNNLAVIATALFFLSDFIFWTHNYLFLLISQIMYYVLQIEPMKDAWTHGDSENLTVTDSSCVSKV